MIGPNWLNLCRSKVQWNFQIVLFVVYITQHKIQQQHNTIPSSILILSYIIVIDQIFFGLPLSRLKR